MKNRFLVLICVLFFVLSCTKDNNGKPTISIESVTTIVPLQGGFEAKLKFTQTNGKLSNGTFIAIRNRLNQIQAPPITDQPDTVLTPIPTFPDRNKGEFTYTSTWAELHQSDIENDTIVFKFAAMGTDSVSTDTVTSEKIVILHQ